MEDHSSKISALLITYNEIDHINEVIENVAFADEIIVIDSFSNDGTFEALQQLKHVTTIQRPFKDFADQRNFAIEQATYNWIFFIDADERLTKELENEILNVVTLKSDIVAYKIPRRFIFNKKIIRFSGLQSDRIFRLFKNGTAKYREDKTVHELLDVKGNHRVLSNYMLHYSFSNYKSYKKKAEHYGVLKAKELFKKREQPNWFHFYIKPAYKFLSNYILRLGFLDGKEGYILCKLNAHGVKHRYKVLKELFRDSPE